jgi:hypothetical protein
MSARRDDDVAMPGAQGSDRSHVARQMRRVRVVVDISRAGDRVSVEEFLDLLECVRKSRRGWIARCPAHDDRTPSMSVAEGDDGRVLVHCFAGCPPAKITAALGLRLTDLFARTPGFDDAISSPPTQEQRQALETLRLRRCMRALELEQRRAQCALHHASMLLAIAYSDNPEQVLTRLWEGAVERLEREAAEAADAYCAEEAHA